MKNKFLKISIIILFLSLFLLLNWNSFTTPYERDEGEYAYSAWLLRTEGMPYKDSFLQKPPLIIYTYLIAQIINENALWPIRLLGAIFIISSAILIYLIARKEWGEITGIFALFLFLPLINFPPLTPFASNTEKFMILPIIGLLALFIYNKNSQKSWPYIIAGILSSFAILYKPIALPVVFFIIIFYLFKLYKINNNFYFILKKFFLIIASGILTIAIIMLPFFKVWHYFFEEVFIFNLSYINAFNNAFENFWNYMLKFFHYWYFLLFLLIGIFYKIPKNILFYFFLFFISLLTIFSTPIGHYYLITIPFLTLILSGSFSSFLELLSNNEKNKKIIAIILTSIIIFILIVSFKEQYALSPKNLSIWVYGNVNPFYESQIVADNLAKITNNDDLVFIAGSEPQIYFYAKRKSSSRFVITYPLNLTTPYREKFQKELIDDLEKNPPKAIIISNRAHSGLWNEGSPLFFIEYLTNLIEREYEIKGGYIWENKNNYWEDSINKENIEKASLLLFTKKINEKSN